MKSIEDFLQNLNFLWYILLAILFFLSISYPMVKKIIKELFGGADDNINL